MGVCAWEPHAGFAASFPGCDQACCGCDPGARPAAEGLLLKVTGCQVANKDSRACRRQQTLGLAHSLVRKGASAPATVEADL